MRRNRRTKRRTSDARRRACEIRRKGGPKRDFLWRVALPRDGERQGHLQLLGHPLHRDPHPVHEAELDIPT